jgi:hypothetical protein
MIVHVHKGTRWVKPVLVLDRNIEVSLTDEQWKAFPWSILDGSHQSSPQVVCLHTGVLCAKKLRLVEEWKTRFHLNGITDRFLTVRMQLERGPEELAVAMGKHPRLGLASQFSRLEPEILQLICDLAYD